MAHFTFVFQEFYKPGPKSWQTSLLWVPVLAYINANVFSILVDQTAVSMLLALLATALPCACLAIYFFHSRQIDRELFPHISTIKALGFALSGLALIALAAYGFAYLPECTTAKCRRGRELIGRPGFAGSYLICLWCGFIGMSSLLLLYEVLRRFFKSAIK